MKMLKNTSKWARLGLFGLVLALGAIGFLVSQPSEAGPQPDCGPTFQWICVVPGCPSCPDYLFEGTVCEKNAYEKQTGRVCSLD